MTEPIELTERQQRILQVIREAVIARGYPPSVREIGEAVGLKSPSSVHGHLGRLEKAGYVRRDPTRPRALELFDRAPPPSGGEGDFTPVRPVAAESDATGPTTAVPLVGRIAAGAPLVAEENVEEVVALPESLVGQGQLFMLHVRGDSMIEAGVHDGDLVVVRQQPAVEQGEMCAALIDGEATVKFFRRTPDGEIFLDPANSAYEPIRVEAEADSAVLGRVVTVMRRL